MMKTKKALPVPVFIPVLLFAFLVLLLIANPLAVHAQEVDATATLEPTLAPTEEPTTEPTVIPDESTTTPEEIATELTEPTEPTQIPTDIPDIPTDTPETPPETPTTEPTLTPVFTEIAVLTLTETISATPTVTSTLTALPLVVPLIQPQGVEIIPDRYIVVYKSAGAAISAEIDSVSALGASVDHQFSSVISGFSASLSPEVLTTLRQDPDIAFIEADQVAWLADDITINSVQTGTTWGLDRIDQRNLPLDDYYNYYLSGAGVNVYLMDSGINTAHPDFGGRASNDFDTVDGGMTDCNGHGTHVAGIIGSNTYGVAKAATIHGVRVMNCEGKGSVSSIIAAVDWITANHVKPAVVNLSYVNGASDAEDLAISRSIAAGITYVAAAGNDSVNACLFSPSRISGVITVGATDLTDTVAGYSNQGSCLDIFAPGSDITSTSLGGSVEIRSGTSMAAPHVSASAALFLQANPSASPADVAGWLIGNSTKGVLTGMNPDSPNRLLFTNPILPSVPSAPVLIRPSNGSVSNQIRPIFAWKMTSTADLYTIQLASDHDFTFILKEETGDFLSYTLDTDLPDGVYYWRVRAVNSNGDPTPGNWSAPFSFTLDTEGPAAPVLMSPRNNASPVGIPSFIWLPISGAAAYQFEVDDTSDFSSPVLTSPDGSISGLPALTKTTFLPTGLLAETPYFWHVRARDFLGNWGAWSESHTVTIQMVIPVSPVQVSPAAGAAFKTNPTLIWNSVPGGVYYQVQIADNVQFSGTLTEDVNKPIGEFTRTISAPLLDKTWYWRVRAFNSTKGAGNWSAVRSFIIDTTGPAAPVLLAPATENTPLRLPVFSWKGAADAKTYQFVLGTSTDGGTSISPLVSTPDGSVPGLPAISLTSFKPASLPLETLCYWHVRAFDGLGNSGNWSEARTITLQSSVPTAPVQINPTAGASVNALPTLSWNAAITAETYEVQISNSTAFPVSSMFIKVESGLNIVPSAPLADGIWYWRVRGINHTGGVGAWSITRAFTMDTQPPLAPVPISPVTSYLFATPAFTWKVSLTANGYQFEYGPATDASIATFKPLYTSPILTTVAHTPPTIPVGMFFWHVRARDAAGNWGPWSGSRSITIQPVIPAAPIVTSPASGYLTRNTTPGFTWNTVTAGVTYQVQIDNQSTFVSPEVNHADTGGLLASTPPSPIAPDGLYYWRVRAFNAAGEPGAWSAVRYFTIDTTPPLAPVLSLPADNAAGLRATPIFYWAATAMANAYQFQIDDNADYSSPVYATSEGTPIVVTYAKPTGLAVLTPYYWHVRARDAAGNWGPWSGSRNITIQPVIPGAPSVTYPSIYGLTNDTTPTFTWNTVTAGATYHIQVDNLATFASPEVNQTDTAGFPYFTPLSPITPNGLYFWRVRAVNAAGETGAWSTVRYFTLDTTPPPVPVLSVPADNAAGIRTIPIFYWAAAATATAYQYQIADNADYSLPVYSTPDGTAVPGTPITVTYAKPTGLVASTLYYWRVRARDYANNWGEWSVSRTITLQP